jgi:hypothetical protein
MRRTLICLLLAISSTKADVLFRDHQEGDGFRFESERKDVQATVTHQEVVELALYWAMKFYRDRSLEVIGLRFETDPLRFWLVTLKKLGANETFYAVALPDGTIVEPRGEKLFFFRVQLAVGAGWEP